MQTITWKYLDQGGILLFWWNWLGSKTNPVRTARTCQTRMWRKRGRGLKQDYSVKGRKEGTAGCMGKFFVVIAYGKGVIGCHQYEGHVNGEMFS